MSTKTFTYAVACTVLLAASTAASAASISALPVQGTIAIGDTVTIQLAGDFRSLSTLGGGFDVFFDSSHLGFVSFGFSDGLLDEPTLRRNPDVLDGELNGIAFGHFDGIGGVFELAIIQFQVLAGGSSQIILAENEDGPPSNPGGFFDFQGLPMTVDFGGTQITAVPLPAAIWLLGAAGSVLLGFSRRHESSRSSSDS